MDERPYKRLEGGARRPEDPPPDYVHWKRLERWTVIEASCLLLDVEPEMQLGRRISKLWFTGAENKADVLRHVPDWMQTTLVEVWALREYADASVKAGTLRNGHYPMDLNSIVPATWLNWAIDKGIPGPPQLDELRRPRMSRSELEQRIADLESLALNLQRDPAQKGTRSGDTQKLRTLQKIALAMAKAQYGWSPGDRNAATGEKKGSVYADIVAQLGKARAVDAETIRAVLTQAETQFPGRED